MSNNLEINATPNKITQSKRISKAPIIIIAAFVILVLFALFYAALARKQNIENNIIKQEETNQIDNTNTTSFIEELEKSKNNSTFTIISSDNAIAQNKEIIPIQQDFLIKKEPEQINIQSNNFNKINYQDDNDLSFKKDMQQKAYLAPTQIETKSNNYSYDFNNSDVNINSKPTLHFNDEEIMAQAKAQAGMFGGSFNTETNDKNYNTSNFLDNQVDNGYLQHKKTKALSPYELKAGWVIPAVLITSINSEIQGQVLAQVSQNVYDSVTGKYLLIPQGTKIVGSYSSNILWGQSRLLVAWNKLIFPDGQSLILDNMQGVSANGLTGFKDKVNNHYIRTFASAILLSSITAGVSLADNSTGEKETAKDKAISSAIEQMSQVAAEIIRKNMNIAPTLEIRSGYKFNIFVTKDIILEPLERY
ncbi:conjugal transfer protein TrbI [Campylobacter sp. RM12640]|uniref:TrbI/VirB10 family protein n=1 Tax=unclassified Campylobacter TaxID=2593542 RepID=UPI001D29F28A|nr:conjugal transfer protein TrbI [Campylobacter sp. RM12642]MBZ7982450.1 conjugal transfer protein TrbI [Campylobacter sp. RM12640]MBZ7989955.1 conjugal transfer protein TrbI [Campylobacter sp. RM12635]MBZ8008232.1 conjugal transfer protein TrbI [Campylobacter sp. RM9334]